MKYEINVGWTTTYVRKTGRSSLDEYTKFMNYMEVIKTQKLSILLHKFNEI